MIRSMITATAQASQMMLTYMNGPPSWKKLFSESNGPAPVACDDARISVCTNLPTIGLIAFGSFHQAAERRGIAAHKALRSPQPSERNMKIMHLRRPALSRQRAERRREHPSPLMPPTPHLQQVLPLV